MAICADNVIHIGTDNRGKEEIDFFKRGGNPDNTGVSGIRHLHADGIKGMRVYDEGEQGGGGNSVESIVIPVEGVAESDES